MFVKKGIKKKYISVIIDQQFNYIDIKLKSINFIAIDSIYYLKVNHENQNQYLLHQYLDSYNYKV